MALLAAYSFDESGLTIIDYSGAGNDFALTSDATRVSSGHTNGGLQATPGTTPLTLPDIGKTTNRTVMMWIKGSMDDVWPIIWNVASIASGAWGIVHLTGNIGIQARSSTTMVRAEVPWSDNTTWHHVAGTYDGTTVRLYLDGVLADSQALTGPIRTDTDPPQLLGWNGDTIIDCLRIYDSALDQTAIATAMAVPVDGNFAESATLAENSPFIKRVTAAMQRYAVMQGQDLLALSTPTAAEKQRLLLAQAALADPTSYGQRFAWAVAADATVDASVDDSTIAAKVAAAWDLIAAVPL